MLRQFCKLLCSIFPSLFTVHRSEKGVVSSEVAVFAGIFFAAATSAGPVINTLQDKTNQFYRNGYRDLGLELNAQQVQEDGTKALAVAPVTLRANTKAAYQDQGLTDQLCVHIFRGSILVSPEIGFPCGLVATQCGDLTASLPANEWNACVEVRISGTLRDVLLVREGDPIGVAVPVGINVAASPLV